ncbi:hypothetical protein Q4485_05040 [Granulosicoccaceae sp. 1_MG-2023]|nr:hypothetical protein [Granulosicoccaceae sp. 1_MG-2023]
MNFLIIVTFLSLFSVDYLANNLQVIPQKMFLIPEAMAAAAMVVVVLSGISRRQLDMAPKYAIFLGWFLLTVTAGLILNHVDSLVAISGMRIYLKSLPFFLLPMVYTFSDKQIRVQLLWLLGLCLTQIPVTLYQRFVQYRGVLTGDPIGGTLGVNTSGVLSILLIFGIALLVGFYFKKLLKAWQAIPLALLLFIPTTLNETKVVLILFPFVIISPLFFAPNIAHRGRKLLLMSVVGSIFMVLFFIAYDVLQGEREGSLVERMKSGNMFSYMFKGTDKVGKFSELEVGRFDAIAFAVDKASNQGHSIFGVGIGNASPSNTDKLVGEYWKTYYWTVPEKNMASRVIWEMGYTGLLIYMGFFIFAFLDAKALARGDDFVAAFALGWTPVVLIMAGSFVYMQTFVITIFSHLFFFYAGHIAATRFRKKKQAYSETEHAKRHDPKRFAPQIDPRGTKKFKPMIG